MQDSLIYTINVQSEPSNRNDLNIYLSFAPYGLMKRIYVYVNTQTLVLQLQKQCKKQKLDKKPKKGITPSWAFTFFFALFLLDPLLCLCFKQCSCFLNFVLEVIKTKFTDVQNVSVWHLQWLQIFFVVVTWEKAEVTSFSFFPYVSIFNKVNAVLLFVATTIRFFCRIIIISIIIIKRLIVIILIILCRIAVVIIIVIVVQIRRAPG